MDRSANYIPLGLPQGQRYFNQEKPQKEKVIGATPEERKRIAAEVRKAAKKEKKLIKADAKRQRKLNAIMHRRMTKNPEKYIKNKDRNRLRAIEAERTKIWNQAVRQAQYLAAKHDPSGKMFNVGEVVTLEDGSVKSVEALAVLERRKAEKAADEEAKKQLGPQALPKKGKSKRQQQKEAALAPRPPPPRPVIPDGISMPKGEEDFIAMWDITDEQIQRRLSDDKRRKSMARKKLRREQKAQKKINKAMKLLKRQTENLGVKWDPIEGRKRVMKDLEGDDSGEHSQESEEEGDDFEDESQPVEDDEEVPEVEEPPTEPAITTKGSKKSKKTKKVSEPASNDDDSITPATPIPGSKPKKAKSLKRPAEEESVEDQKPKKSKKCKKSKDEPTEAVEAVESSATNEDPSNDLPAVEEDVEDKTPSKAEKRALKEEKRVKKEQKRARQAARLAKKAKKEEAKSTTAIEENGEWSYKKRKHEDDEDTEKSHKKKNKNKEAVDQSDLPPSLDKHGSYYTKPSGEAGNGAAAQWNPDALTGEAARKDKFLRLLGAGKANAAAGDGAKHKSTAKVADISKVQSDLERQYEAGMKTKHDGGGKRRGLGA